MDKRLSVLIKEIKRSSRNSSSSIVNLIKLERDSKKSSSAVKKESVAKVDRVEPIKIDTAPKIVEYIPPKIEPVVEDMPASYEAEPVLETKESVKEDRVDTATNNIEVVEKTEPKIVNTGVSEELKRVAMTGMKLTKSTKARQKEYSKAKRLEDKKKKALEKEEKEKLKKHSIEKAKDPNTPFGALSLSMDRLDEQMKQAMAKIDEDILDIKNGLPNVLTEDEEETLELAKENEKNIHTSEETIVGSESVEVEDTLVDTTTEIEAEVEAKIDTIDSMDSKDKDIVVEADEENSTSIAEDNTKEVAVSEDKGSGISGITISASKRGYTSSIDSASDTYNIAQYVAFKGERKMDRAYDLNKVNEYAKILNEVSSGAHEKKAKELALDNKVQARLLSDVKTAINPAVELKPMRVMYVCSECQPFIATGGLADVAGSLPEAIKQANPYADMRVVMPLYSDIKEEYKSKFEFVANFTVHLSWRHQPCDIYKFVKNNVTYYFLGNDYYFNRKGSYGYFDDGERYAFFSKAVVEALPVLDYFPNVMHCNDWQSALTSIYMKTCYNTDYRYNSIKHVFTIHNIQYQGRFGKHLLGDLFGIDYKYMQDIEYDGDINLVKCAIHYSDFFTTVSPSYCDDLKEMEHSYGLYHEVRNQQYKLRGILNGIDYNFYNPETDSCIYRKYNINSLDKKVENKLSIQKEYGLPISKNTPLIVMATRLVSHKGLDLISRIMDEVLRDDVQFMIVGTGDDKYIEYFKSLEARHPNKVKALVGQYSNPIARKLYAAGDIYVMPSKNEPCGLSQMISSIYGCVPIVRETGGLKDSIKDFGCPEGGNGYTFTHYNAHDLLYSIRRAVADYSDRKEWTNKMKVVMKVDFSWNKPAKDYLTLYNQLV